MKFPRLSTNFLRKMSQFYPDTPSKIVTKDTSSDCQKTTSFRASAPQRRAKSRAAPGCALHAACGPCGVGISCAFNFLIQKIKISPQFWGLPHQSEDWFAMTSVYRTFFDTLTSFFRLFYSFVKNTEYPCNWSNIFPFTSRKAARSAGENTH